MTGGGRGRPTGGCASTSAPNNAPDASRKSTSPPENLAPWKEPPPKARRVLGLFDQRPILDVPMTMVAAVQMGDRLSADT